MIRIIGFITGAFLAVGAVLVFVGTPDFPRQGADDARMDAAIENLKRKWEESAAAAGEPSAGPANAAVADGAEDRPGTTEAPAGAGATLVAGADGMPAPNDGAAAPPAAAGPEPEWHAFWTPFRTEIAARGFVSRLEAVTGLDYRVAKLRTGAWQVAFAYRSEADVDAGLEQIAAATGLDVAPHRP